MIKIQKKVLFKKRILRVILISNKRISNWWPFLHRMCDIIDFNVLEQFDDLQQKKVSNFKLTDKYLINIS